MFFLELTNKGQTVLCPAVRLQARQKLEQICNSEHLILKSEKTLQKSSIMIIFLGALLSAMKSAFRDRTAFPHNVQLGKNCQSEWASAWVCCLSALLWRFMVRMLCFVCIHSAGFWLFPRAPWGAHAAPWNFSIHGDIQKPSGHSPRQPAVGCPAWTRVVEPEDLPEVPSNLNYSVTVWILLYLQGQKACFKQDCPKVLHFWLVTLTVLWSSSSAHSEGPSWLNCYFYMLQKRGRGT